MSEKPRKQRRLPEISEVNDRQRQKRENEAQETGIGSSLLREIFGLSSDTSDYSENNLRRITGFNPKVFSEIEPSLQNKKVPPGYTSREEFEETILSRIAERRRAPKGIHYQARLDLHELNPDKYYDPGSNS